MWWEEVAKKFIWPVDFSVDYRYSNHEPRVQTSACIRGQSCQAGLCHVSCMNVLQHNEKTAVALHVIQFQPLTLPSQLIISDNPPVSIQVWFRDKKMESPEHGPHFSSGTVSRHTRSQLKNASHKRPNSFWGVSNKDSRSSSSK